MKLENCIVMKELYRADVNRNYHAHHWKPSFNYWSFSYGYGKGHCQEMGHYPSGRINVPTSAPAPPDAFNAICMLLNKMHRDKYKRLLARRENAVTKSAGEVDTATGKREFWGNQVIKETADLNKHLLSLSRLREQRKARTSFAPIMDLTKPPDLNLVDLSEFE
jgi:hypothetical protein